MSKTIAIRTALRTVKRGAAAGGVIEIARILDGRFSSMIARNCFKIAINRPSFVRFANGLDFRIPIRNSKGNESWKKSQGWGKFWGNCKEILLHDDVIIIELLVRVMERWPRIKLR